MPSRRGRSGPFQSVRRPAAEDIPKFGKDTPMGRPGQPNEVAPSFLFLACEDASYMTGRCCTLTAGYNLELTGIGLQL